MTPGTLLRLVGVLHARGYQRLRIHPGLAPSGMHWRCALTAGSEAVTYSSAGDDLPEDPDLFLERFPALAAAARGSDEPYAAWYQAMLAALGQGDLPIAYADWELPPGMTTVNGSTLPLEPPLQ